MKKVNLLLVLGLVMALFMFPACEDDGDDTHPLVGTWSLSDLWQGVNIYTAEAVMDGAWPEGTFVGGDTLTWTEFGAMGVSGTVVLNDDNSFTITGNFPTANDTLGAAPHMNPISDSGTWSAAEDNSTLQIVGDYFMMGGALTMDDPESPSEISLQYTTVDSFDAVMAMGPGTYVGFKCTRESESKVTFSK